jgi:spore coat polysaccharide biosynthesis protein SpsF
MTTVAVIQARMGSTRLPGKVALPLAGETVLERVVERVSEAEAVDTVVVAAPDLECDDVVAYFARKAGAEVHRGPQEDVLGRLYGAATAWDPDTVVRVSADSPLVLPTYIDHAVSLIETENFQYVTDALDRTFPLGVCCEAFTRASFETVQSAATAPDHREHVTTYYRDNLGDFDYYKVDSSTGPFDESLVGRTDLRFTVDRAADYELLRRIYEGVTFDTVLDVPDAIRYVDENDLATLNSHVGQR